MRHHLRLGASFSAIEDEFSSPKVVKIRALANEKIKEALALDDQASRVVFETFQYGFVALRTGKAEWTLEVAKLPPHAERGGGVSTVRRKRERQERKQAEEAKKTRKAKKGERPSS